MRECKRLTKEFDKEVKALENNFDRETNKMLNEKKQSMFKELNSYVALKKKHATNIDHKRIELFEGPNEGFGDEDQQMADAPDIAKPSAPAPASSSYSLESIFRQLSEMSTLQASRHKEVCSLIRNIDFRIQSMVRCFWIFFPMIF
ncbi:hypothetical protein VIGAN_01369900 [Vigna angularis var. angularis]|uniref:Uncharacterized protein n=1 Tax=Vigna angularis var. angularis TaxID=157739 RepID=A0A0S3R565_PHAAN|nr:hypothetical protein VIGAN_01369900 [Vigna angularis var. angularis]